MEWKGEPTSNPSTAPGLAQGDSGTQPAGTWPKAQVERTKWQTVWEEALGTEDFYRVEEDVWHRRAPKAAETESPLPSPGASFSLMPRWKGKRGTEWDECTEWRYLTANLSPLVEQLRERFSHLEMCDVEPV